MIGFIIAHKSETISIEKSIKVVKRSNVNGFDVLVFYVLNECCALVYSGVGKVNAAAATQTLIDFFKVDTVINLGSCGGVNKNVDIMDIIIPKQISYYDVDATAFKYKPNQVPHEPEYFETNNKLADAITTIMKPYKFHIYHGKCATGENFINKGNYAKFDISKEVLAVDMEACAIAQVCHHCDVKFVAVKMLTDSIYAKHDNHFD
ncbi:5'-methylthioadenosine/S-adenosylhomocysteine nucleosidase [Bacilli bacterium]|nr:5'-methylthioadenosine/S-adenosylhomocysteine nucleosidase [Bacilli bacterium]